MKTLIALTISGLIATSAMANENEKATDLTDKVAIEASSEFIKLDLDRDASLTKMEVSKDPKLNSDGFARADINQDGELNRDEFVAWFKTDEMSKQYSSAPVEEGSMNEDQDEEEQDDKEY